VFVPFFRVAKPEAQIKREIERENNKDYIGQ
jgi:hypothetical protein